MIKNKFLQRVVNWVFARWFFIFVNLLSLLFNIDATQFIVPKIVHDRLVLADNGDHAVNIVFMGLGCIMVALGVFMESRHIVIRKESTGSNALQEHLNESAEFYGALLLTVGLVIESAVVLIEIPNHVINTHDAEKFLYCATLGFVFIGSCLNFFYIKDSIQSYFRKW